MEIFRLSNWLKKMESNKKTTLVLIIFLVAAFLAAVFFGIKIIYEKNFSREQVVSEITPAGDLQDSVDGTLVSLDKQKKCFSLQVDAIRKPAELKICAREDTVYEVVSYVSPSELPEDVRPEFEYAKTSFDDLETGSRLFVEFKEISDVSKEGGLEAKTIRIVNEIYPSVMYPPFSEETLQ